ncbi:MAG: MazG nucleotide pyrophosphohydrolase domain-containing protein [Candidatus Bathyarchaeia archaeon]
MMRRIYFHKDSQRGAEGTYKWLTGEVEELGVAMGNAEKRALEDEFADVIAWLASLANILDVDLEKAALRKYADRCPKCQHSPCKCIFRTFKH